MSAGYRLIAALLTLVSGCTAIADIDVCSRPLEQEAVVNLRTDGDQRLAGPAATAPTPDGDAVFVVYRDESGPRLVTSLVSSAGTPQTAWEQPGSHPELGEAAIALAPDPSAEQDEVGLLVYVEEIPPAPLPLFRIMAVALTRNGTPSSFPSTCRYPDGTPQDSSALVIAEVQGHPSGAPAVVSFGADGYVVSWTTSRVVGGVSTGGSLHARRVRLDLCADFPGSARDPDGDFVSLLEEGNQPARVSVVRTPEGFFALWYEERAAGFDIVAGAWTEALGPLVAPFVVADSDTQAHELLLDPDPSFRTALGFDGEQLLGAWVGREDVGGPSRVIARFFNASGRFLRSSKAPDGGPFPLGSASAGSEAAPALVDLGGGGFLAALSEREEPGRVDRSHAGIRASVYDAFGDPGFANPACGASDFALNAITANAQESPSLVRLRDDTVVATWSDESGTLPDRDGTAVRALFLPERALRPIP
jgi:hypothetical protein